MRPRKHHTIAGRLHAAFGLDDRSLAALRMALGGLLLIDLTIRAVDFAAMYTDRGLAPVSLVRSQLSGYQWSLHLISGATAFQAALFVAAGVLAVMMLVGYQTRLATLGSWILLASLHGRLPVVLNAGDTLLRAVLFWSMFLPLGRRWSLDAKRLPIEASTVVSAASFAYVVQLAIVYWMAGWAKWNDAWLGGDAVHDALSYGLYSLPLAPRLAAHPELTRWLTVATVGFELLAPCLLLLPLAAPRWATTVRLLMVAALTVFHVGIAATVTVGLFSYVALAAWLGLLPASFWNRLRLGVRQTPASTGERLAIPLLDLYREGQPALAFSQIAAASVIMLALSTVVARNLAEVGLRLPRAVRPWVRSLAEATALRQSWSLFSRPPRENVWFVYEARLVDGRQLELLSRQEGVEHRRPARPSQQFANHRWRKLHHRLQFREGAPYRQPLAEYVCRRWNQTHPPEEQIVELKLFAYREPFDDGGQRGIQSRELLGRVVAGNAGGNFADAVRELDQP